jgi:hypothetical protein
VRAKSEIQESHFMLPGMQKSVREWTHTLPSGLPLWELESRWTPKSLEGDCNGQTSLDWNILYTIGKLLKHKCLKWAHNPFRYFKHKLWLKEGSRVKLSIWLPTTKSQESPWFAYVQVVCHISLKRSQWGLKLCLVSHLNQRFVQKVISLQSCKNPNFENFKTPNLGVLRQNDISMQVPWLSTNNTIRGKVVASPKSGLWWVLWIHVCMWLVHAPKVLQLHTNQLVI